MRTRNPPPESRKLPIAIACRLDKEVALKITRKVLDYLFKEKQVKVALENRIAQRFYPHLRMDLRQMTADKIKMVLSIGGDGTILRVAQNLPYKNPAPILGVNLGSVGFLDECDSNEDDLYKTLDKIVEGKYFIENVMRISGIYNGQRLPDALNEIYICSAKPSKVLHVGI
ncbi:MAG: NAD(+)/NADH kinase, partial [Promethearchaeota archaeon]